MHFKKNYWLIASVLFVSTLLGFAIFYPKSPKVMDNFVLYYGNTCPHCIALEEYMKTNNIEAKLPERLIKKEVFENRINSNELVDRAASCGINDLQQVGVPFLWHDGKCYIGQPDAQKHLDDLTVNK